MREFKVDVPQARLDAIRRRVAAFPWDAMPDAGQWRAGTALSFMRNMAAHWLDRFDWRAQERALNRHPQFQATVDGVDLHFYHVRSPEPAARPLMLIHGWPGSVFEFHHLIDPLTDPRRHGGEAADAFHVIVPALPGYGFSGRPPRPIGPAEVATLFAKLMTEVLGYEAYISQGGDWGGIVSTLLGHQDPDHCRGIHLNMLAPLGPPIGAEEVAWAEAQRRRHAPEGGYSQVQMTKPQSLGFAMTDSPVGVAAWIVEKFAGWSDLPKDAEGQPDLLARYSYDQLLTNVMFYLAQDSFVTSTWLYRGYLETADELPFSKGLRCQTPTGYAAFPDPVFAPPPRSMAERAYNIVRWTPMSRGGHFAALEAPELLLDDLRAFVRMVWR